MPNVANLATLLTANAMDLDQGLGKAGDKLMAFDRSVTQSMSNMSAMMSSAAGVAAAVFDRGMAAAERYAQKVGQLNQDASRLGTSLVQTEAIRKFAGSHADELVNGLSHLNRILGEVQAGSKEASKELAAVGLDANKLAQLSGFDRLRALADHLKSLPNEMQKLAAVHATMGKGGEEILGTLTKGATALDEALAGTEARLGAVLGSSQKAKDLLKQEQRTKDAEQAADLRIGEAMAPFRTEWAEFKANMVQDFWYSLQSYYSEWGEEADAMDRIRAERQAHFRELNGAGNAAAEKPKSIRSHIADAYVYENPNALRDVERDFVRLRGSFAEVFNAKNIELAKGLADAVDPKNVEAFTDAMERLQDTVFAEGNKAWESTRTSLERFKMELADLNFLMQQGAIDGEVYQRSVVGLYNALDTLSEKHQLAGAIDATGSGARAAYSALVQPGFNNSESASARVERIQNQLLEESKRTARNTQQMADALQRAGVIKKLEP
jgi:hypothetical protein